MNPYLIIRILGPKNGHPTSKGTRQWKVLRRFGGKTVGEFIAAAREETAASPDDTFQQGYWWNAELHYCEQVKGIIQLDAPAGGGGSGSAGGGPAGGHSGPTEGGDPRDARGGLYIAVPHSGDDVPVNLNEWDGLLVNRDCCKAGKTRRAFAAREGDYRRTFPTGVTFTPVARVTATWLDLAEAAVKGRLHDLRMRSPRGHRPRTEWLKGITPDEAREIILAVLRERGIPHVVVEDI